MRKQNPIPEKDDTSKGNETLDLGLPPTNMASVCGGCGSQISSEGAHAHAQAKPNTRKGRHQQRNRNHTPGPSSHQHGIRGGHQQRKRNHTPIHLGLPPTNMASDGDTSKGKETNITRIKKSREMFDATPILGSQQLLLAAAEREDGPVDVLTKPSQARCRLPFQQTEQWEGRSMTNFLGGILCQLPC